MGPAVERHVVIADHVAEDESRPGHHVVVLAVERVVQVHDVAAADSVERQVAVAADRGCDVVGRLGQLRELFPGVYLRVGDDDEPVARIVARAAQQPEVAGSASGRQRPEKAYDALFRRGVVSRRHADEDEPALRIGFQRVISLFVGPGESVAVGDPDVRHAPAVADDASFDRNRARSPCAGAPER